MCLLLAREYWLSWEEVQFYAALFDFPTVPQLDLSLSKQMDKQEYASSLITAASLDSQFIARDTYRESL